MDPDRLRMILAMVVLVAFSAYFSATETAFSSLNRIRLKTRSEDGDKKANLVLRLSEDFDRLLSTILVGNNIVNILLAALATVFFVDLYGTATGATVATAVSTVVVLIFGEISPKSIAKDHADGFAAATAPFLRVMMVILYPVNWLFSLWKRLLKAVFRTPEDSGVTEEELLTIVEEAEEDGNLNEQESELIHRVITFNDREAVDILIPRVDITGVSADEEPAEMEKLFAETGYSRLPVYEETLDNVVGVVHLKDHVRAPELGPRELMKPAQVVPPTMKIRLLLRQLQQEKSHMAVVADEYGGTLGIVTMEDILEELVGEIWDEHDDVEESIRPLDDGSYLILCSTNLDEMMELLERETACEAATVSGWVMEAVGRIPVKGDAFVADGLDVTVTAVEKNRPEEIRVRAIEPAPADE